MKKAIFVLALIALTACSTEVETENYSEIVEEKEQIKEKPKHFPEGKKIMETECFLCHNVATPEDERVAPPMIGVKAHYIKEGTTKEEFMSEFMSFMKEPTQEKAKMHSAVKRFGVMPYQQFGEEKLTKIAEYLYDYQIEEPVWFAQHWRKKHSDSYLNRGKKIVDEKTEKTKEEIGLSYALGTKKVLGKNLMGTIQKKGTLEALQFCNQRAYPLTDSMSTQFNAIVKRVSDKPRNPENKANQKELSIIEQYKKVVAEKGEITPITEEINGKTQFYYPIVTNSMCLQCHGTPQKQIKPDVLEKLKNLYPKDSAKGYDANQVRGIWSITFTE